MLRLLLITKLIFGRYLKICLYSAYILNLIFFKSVISPPLLKKGIYKYLLFIKNMFIVIVLYK